jgi:hypothetical protein
MRYLETQIPIFREAFTAARGFSKSWKGNVLKLNARARARELALSENSRMNSRGTQARARI